MKKHLYLFLTMGLIVRCGENQTVQKALKKEPIQKENIVVLSEAQSKNAEIQTGKNKGKQCALNAVNSDAAPPLCKKHSKCNVVLYKSS